MTTEIEILTTVHGSRLYGLSREGSDYDTYRVVDVGRTRQTMDGTNDVTTVTLGDFLRQAAVGVPQALEALWSPIKVVDPAWESFLWSFYPSREATIDRYERTIHNFFEAGTAKKYRHALRLQLNLSQYKYLGWFCPTLNEDEVEYVNYKMNYVYPNG